MSTKIKFSLSSMSLTSGCCRPEQCLGHSKLTPIPRPRKLMRAIRVKFLTNCMLNSQDFMILSRTDRVNGLGQVELLPRRARRAWK